MPGRYCVIPSESTSNVFSRNSYTILNGSFNSISASIDAYVGTGPAKWQERELQEGGLLLGGLSRKVMVLPDNNILSR